MVQFYLAGKHQRAGIQGVSLFVGMSKIEQKRFGPGVADELEADGEALGIEAAGDADGGDAGEVCGHGVHVVEVHGERVGGLFAKAEGDGR